MSSEFASSQEVCIRFGSLGRYFFPSVSKSLDVEGMGSMKLQWHYQQGLVDQTLIKRRYRIFNMISPKINSKWRPFFYNLVYEFILRYLSDPKIHHDKNTFSVGRTVFCKNLCIPPGMEQTWLHTFRTK